MKKNTKKLVTIEQYAEMCGISKITVYHRINAGEILPESIRLSGYSTTVVDIDKYPPKPAKRRGRKKYKGIINEQN